ncbi:hypothetical protein ACFYWN_15965 [Streptomyces sp. NPDC002917]|uniref:hypothetical protein n=1 Tax=Streptomyces sp. NPDC002917 TaxID=3364671 RepID=UPI0036B6D036
MDLALTGMAVRPGTVLDGEAVEGRLDFGAAQSSAASSVTPARALAARNPASYACWDLVQHPDPAIGDTRPVPYTGRCTLLLELLAEAGPPLQPVPTGLTLAVLCATVVCIVAICRAHRADVVAVLRALPGLMTGTAPAEALTLDAGSADSGPATEKAAVLGISQTPQGRSSFPGGRPANGADWSGARAKSERSPAACS